MKKLFLIGACFVINQTNAQEAVLSSGGNSSGINGNLAYSIGQTFYTTINGTNAYLTQGVEQPFEIQTVLGLDAVNISLELAIFPNPTTDIIYLTVKESNFDSLQYQLYDINGRLIEDFKISEHSTIIQLNNYEASVYLLKVINGTKDIKTFKIIKK